MAHFCYEVREPNGEILFGQAKGPGHLDVALELRKVGYEVIRVWQKPPYLPGGRVWRMFGQVPLAELALLTRELAMFFSSGIGLMRGLQSIQEQGFSKQTGQAAEDVARSLAEGNGLSQSMALRPDVFRPVYLRLVHAGEVSGALEQILRQLSEYLERELLLRRRVQSALAYPALIFLLCVGITTFLLFFLFPTFLEFFNGLNMEMPAITQSLLTVTSLSRQPLFLITLTLTPFLLYRLYDRLSRSTTAVGWLAQLVLDLPLLGSMTRAVIFSRFCSTLAILLRSGVPQFTALSIAGKALGNKAAEEALERCAERIKNDGDSLSEALAKEPLFPRMMISLVLVGEEVGTLPTVLDLAAANFELDVDTTISRLTVLLEPVMLSIMGLIVGYVLLAVFLPIYSMLDGL